jgi:hypothetical protein
MRAGSGRDVRHTAGWLSFGCAAPQHLGGDRDCSLRSLDAGRRRGVRFGGRDRPVAENSSFIFPGTTGMKTKDEYLAEAKAQLDEWEADLTELRHKASEASDDVREAVEQQIAELKAKWDQGAARRQEVLEAADDKWDAIKDEAEEQWAQLKLGAKDALDRIKSLFS